MTFRARLVLTAFTALIAFVHDRAGSATIGPPSLAEVPAAFAFAQPNGWPAILRANKIEEMPGPGVRHERWKLVTASGPLEISIATIELHNPNVALVAASHQGVIQGSGERLSSMADRLHAELGINADYFDINESGAPLNVLAESGRLVHQPDAAAAFIALTGNRVALQTMKWHATITAASGNLHEISTLNEWSASSALSLITPELGRAEAGGALEIVFAPQPAASNNAPQPAASNNQVANYRVTAIESNLGELLPLASGQLAIAVRGVQAQDLAKDFAVGDNVTIAMDTDPPLADIQTAVGGGPLLLRGGQYVADPAAPAPEETNVRNPVTAAGLAADGATLWLVVVDGRSPSVSVGLTRPMLASLMARLGAATAMAFDSGGSSEMVVRHLGDTGVSVATIPSDGRERNIADGLFVVNTAPLGAPQQLLVRAPAQSVLVGSHLQIYASAIDGNDQPLPLNASDLRYTVAPLAAADVSDAGLLTARRAATAIITVQTQNLSTQVRLQILPEIQRLEIVAFDRTIPRYGRTPLSIVAHDPDGKPISVDPTAIQWNVRGAGGAVDAAGVFSAGPQPAVAHVTARVGEQQASLILLTGDHRLQIQNRLLAGSETPQWHFKSQPSDVNGGVDNAAAPDGASALRLRYDFSGNATTRAAYVESALTMCGEPLAVTLDVYGDANGEWLRGGYRNADGNNESLTLARHIDWRGWKTVHATIPHQAAWPIVWTRFYTVERAKDAIEQGALWLRNFAALYAGPASLGCSGLR